MTIHSKSLSDPIEPTDGTRLLITRYRPWGVRRGEETWDEWDKALAPSVSLLDDSFGKRREGSRVLARGLPRISWEEFVTRFLEEMASPVAQTALSNIQERNTAGETITLLCFCRDTDQCHRFLVAKLLNQDVELVVSR